MYIGLRSFTCNKGIISTKPVCPLPSALPLSATECTTNGDIGIVVKLVIYSVTQYKALFGVQNKTYFYR